MGRGNLTLAGLRAYCQRARKALGTNSEIGTMGLRDACRATSLMDSMNPKNIMRECVENEEHPDILPVILALDVTGSMGSTAVQISRQIAQIVFEIYKEGKGAYGMHPEFCIMGIGDIHTDRAPVQMGQFESDTRIISSIDNLFFENNGGSNGSESYTAAWYAGLNHTNCSCWSKGRKGLIITIGDEKCNTSLPISKCRHIERGLATVFGDALKKPVFTKELYTAASQKFVIAHIGIARFRPLSFCTNKEIDASWAFLKDNYYSNISLDNLKSTIIGIVNECARTQSKIKPKLLTTEATPD